MIAAMIFLLAMAKPALAQNLNWEFKVSTTTVELGVPVAVSGMLSSDAAQDLSLDIPNSSSDTVSINAASFDKTEISGGKRLQRFTLTLVPLGVGRIPVATAWQLAQGSQIKSFISPPLWLDVKTPQLPPEAQPIDIKAPRPARRLLWPWLLLAALAALGYWLYRDFSQRQEETQVQQAPVDSRPAEVIAEEELCALETSSLWSEERYKEFYIRLTDILRQYLERRYNVPAMLLTTSELKFHLRQAEVDRLISAKIKQVLDRADLIKFAKIAPESPWGAEDVEITRAIVKETSPRNLQEANPQ